ncbi:MAG TPA: MmcQ/YjbR family DNA-binding protein [Chitinophagales bacterium]|nr:MmcQ/YjbR family DNA-binding protein [Chitinophagales bacterium]
MNIEFLREFCLSKPGVTEGFPFDEDALVFKVMGKMFLLMSLGSKPLTMNVKCDPGLAVELRERYPEAVTGAFHMNKKHWNSVNCESGLIDDELKEMIDHSYALVVKGLPKKDREKLGAAKA